MYIYIYIYIFFSPYYMNVSSLVFHILLSCYISCPSALISSMGMNSFPLVLADTPVQAGDFEGSFFAQKVKVLASIDVIRLTLIFSLLVFVLCSLFSFPFSISLFSLISLVLWTSCFHSSVAFFCYRVNTYTYIYVHI